jgi:hypothetical protein
MSNRPEPEVSVTTESTQHHAIQVKGARNQALFREVNDRVETLNNSWSSISSTIEFICECSDDSCFKPLSLTTDDYRAIRADPARFFVAPEHVDPRIEDVIRTEPSYWVVEKIESGRAVAIAAARREQA